MRASRLLSIMLMLSVRGRVSASELADELEVSVRTIYRDVEALGAAGVPVYATRGRGGGVQLVDGFRPRLTGLSSGEAEALVLGGVPGAAADLGLGGVLAASQLKLLAAMPPDLRRRASAVRDRFLVDAPGWLRDADTPPFLPVVATAVWDARRLAVHYENARHEGVDRVLEPWGLVLKAGVWYLVARTPQRASPRTYRVSRIRAAAVLAEGFTPPADFDLESFWASYQADYAARVYSATARVRLGPDGVRLLFLLGAVPARRARATLSAPDAAGWVEAEVPIESVEHGRRALLQLGEDVEVVGPEPLVTALARTAGALARRYGARCSGACSADPGGG